MIRSIPPRTMRDRWTEERERKGRRLRPAPPEVGIGAPPKIARPAHPFRPKAYQRPKEWAFVTKPFFAKIREPLVDVFKEAKEVKIIIELGGFSRDEVDIDIKPDKYVIFAKHEEQEFREEIDLPPDVDIEKTVENFKHGILEITLPKKKDRHKAGRKKKRD